MGQSPEIPPTNNQKQEFTPEEEAEITAKWYFDTSFEGRTGAEFKALREEVRKATTLDFDRLRDDRDYAGLIYENPHVQEFMRDMTVFDLERIHEHRKDIGLSEEQFQKLLAIFDQDIQDALRKEIADGEAVTRVFKAGDKHFSSAEIKDHSNETLAAMKREIELQEKNIPHPMTKLTWFPRRKKQK